MTGRFVPEKDQWFMALLMDARVRQPQERLPLPPKDQLRICLAHPAYQMTKRFAA